MATWYIATTGNDTTGDGSVGNPWRTHQHAGWTATSVLQGDTIIAAAGTYDESYSGSYGLRLNKGLLFLANGVVTLRGAHVSPPGFNQDNIVYFDGTTVELSFEGYVLDALTAGAQIKAHYVYNKFAAGVRFKRCVLKNATEEVQDGQVNSKIYFEDNCQISTTSGALALAFVGKIFSITDSAVILVNATAQDYIFNTVGSVETAGTITFQNSKFYINTPANIVYFYIASGVYTVINQLCAWTIPTTTANVALFKIVNNTFSFQGSFFETFTTNHFPLLIAESTGAYVTGHKFNYNTWHTRSFGGIGVIFGVDQTEGSAGDNKLNGGEMIGNKCYGPIFFNPALSTQTSPLITVHGLMTGYNLNTKMYYNYVNGFGFPLPVEHLGTDGGSWTSGGLCWNVVVNSRGNSYIVKAVNGLKVYNNVAVITLDGCLYPMSVRDGDQADKSTHFCSGVDIRNNIVYTNLPTASIGAIFYVDQYSQNGFTSNNNCLYIGGAGGGAYGRVAGVLYNTFAEWQAFRNQELNSLSTDPLFEAVGKDSFWLSNGSPCRGTGANTGTGDYDSGLFDSTVFGVSAAYIRTGSRSGTYHMGSYLNRAMAKSPLVGWSTNARFEIDGASYLGANTDQVVIRIPATKFPANFWSIVKSDGSDVRFTDADQSTMLPYEVESFNYAGQTAFYRLLVPKVFASKFTYFYLFYGNASAADGSNKEAVFPRFIRLAYAMNSNKTEGATDDTTQFDHDLVNTGTTDTAGAFDRGRAFNGSTQKMVATKTPYLAYAKEWAMIASIKPAAIGTTQAGVGISIWGSTASAGYSMHLHSTSKLVVSAQVKNSTTQSAAYSNAVLVNGTWYRGAMSVRDGYVRQILNGVVQTQTTAYTSECEITANYNFHLGNRSFNNDYWLNGVIDDVMFTDTRCSDDWLKADYQSVNGVWLELAPDIAASVFFYQMM